MSLRPPARSMAFATASCGGSATLGWLLWPASSGAPPGVKARRAPRLLMSTPARPSNGPAAWAKSPPGAASSAFAFFRFPPAPCAARFAAFARNCSSLFSSSQGPFLGRPGFRDSMPSFLKSSRERSLCR